MIVFFGVSIYINQMLSGQGGGASSNPNQDTVNKITPFLISGMFLIFPLPAGVLMYMSLANVFQTAQTFILSREPLPEEIQKLVEAEAKQQDAKEALPFEPGKPKKSEDTAKPKKSAEPTKSAEPPARSKKPDATPADKSKKAGDKGSEGSLPFEGKKKKA
jgi:YidC/Oxa1 family membrane protein insertase